MGYKLLYAQVVEDDTKQSGVALAVDAVLGGGLSQKDLWVADCKLWSSATVPKLNDWVFVDTGAPAGKGVFEAPSPPLAIMGRESTYTRGGSELVEHFVRAVVAEDVGMGYLGMVGEEFERMGLAESFDLPANGIGLYVARYCDSSDTWQFWPIPKGESDE